MHFQAEIRSNEPNNLHARSDGEIDIDQPEEGGAVIERYPPRGVER